MANTGPHVQEQANSPVDRRSSSSGPGRPWDDFKHDQGSVVLELEEDVDADECRTGIRRTEKRRNSSLHGQPYESLLKSVVDGPWNSEHGRPDIVLTAENKRTYGAMTKVAPWAYLGACSDASDVRALKKKGIVAVMNAAFELPNFFPADFEYMNIPVDDFASTVLSFYFDCATDFLEKCRAAKRTVLIHCAAGRSRSATLFMAYLIRFQHKSLHEAFVMLHHARGSVAPNKSFLKQLSDWERDHLGSSTYDDLPIIKHPELYYQAVTDLRSHSFRMIQDGLIPKEKKRFCLVC